MSDKKSNKSKSPTKSEKGDAKVEDAKSKTKSE